MNSMPSQTGRFNYDATTSTSTASPSASSSPSRENSLGRRSSSTLNKALFEHNLSSILNNPHSPRSGDASWSGWWSSSTSVATLEFAPISTSKPEFEAKRSDFQPYLSSISEQHHRFEDIRNHTNKEDVDVDNIGGQGEALVACLREVPALYFKEDFQLEDGATFRAACPFSNMSENLVLQERLSQYLDVVEMHLVKEISLRSNSFFEAQRQLEDLNVKVVEGCKRIRELKETIRLLDSDLVDSARDIQELNGSRSNLLALQEKLTLILYVNQALSALQLLVTSADCAGALDIADDLQHLLDTDELAGLHCFRHLRDRVATSIESINSILSAEFMHASIHDAEDLDATILSRAKYRASVPTNGKYDEDKLNEEETSNFRDCLLPLIIGLLRTAKLPSVLRMYRDTLTGDMKTAIKTTVAELLPVLVVRPVDSDFTPGERIGDADGGGSSLASRLRSLSSESFVQLLTAIFKIVMAHLMRAAEVKRSIEWIMCNLDGHYAADSVAAAIAHGAAAAESTEVSDAQDNSLLPYHAQRNTVKVSSLLGKSNEASSPSNLSRNLRADVLRENTEAVFAACDAAYGRWAKLLGVRALVHPRLRLQEFLSIYRITQEFINATEKIGGRLGYSIRGTLQSQVKSFVDFQHESRMTKIKALLDQETWVQVDVPDEFQTIVNSMLAANNLMTENSADDEGNLTLNDGPSVDNSGEANGQHNMQQAGPVPLSHIINSNTRDRAKFASQTLVYKGVSYHMVNCGLILLKMLSEYVEMNNNLPALSSEVVHRVVEVLKFFNTRTCQLVLGAGAMQVSGLKSITSKHLALASQVISFIYVIIPDIRRVLFQKVPETRRALLLLEIDRVAQDYKVHRDEIHTKLVQIMRERLLVHLRTLPRIMEDWNKPEDNDIQPSQFAKGLMREVNFLHKVLSRILQETDVKGIFRQVLLILHTQLSEAFSHLEISTPQANNRLRQDVLHILGCIRLLPSDLPGYNDTPNWGQLDEFFTNRFGDKAVQ